MNYYVCNMHGKLQACNRMFTDLRKAKRFCSAMRTRYAHLGDCFWQIRFNPSYGGHCDKIIIWTGHQYTKL